MLNYTSALLILGAERPQTVLVSRRAIEGVPRGLPLGIPDAPDSLPDRARLAAAPWTVCSVATAEAERAAPRSAPLIGATAAGGRSPGDDAVLLRHPDGGLHLLWHARRFPLRDTSRSLAALATTRQRAVPAALATTRQRAVPAAPALIDSLPVGADLAPPQLPGLGRPSARVTGALVGDVFLIRNSGRGRQYAVALAGGLAGVTELQSSLLLARTGQSGPEAMTLGRFAGLPKRPDLVPTGPAAPPASPPRLAAPDGGALCVGVNGDGEARDVRLGAAVPDLAGSPRTGGGSPRGAALADHVVVALGRGAVVESAAAPGATGGALSVVTDLGWRYALTDPEVLGTLGYRDVRPLRLPAGVVSLVPAGSPLDPAAARAVAAPA